MRCVLISRISLDAMSFCGKMKPGESKLDHERTREMEEGDARKPRSEPIATDRQTPIWEILEIWVCGIQIAHKKACA
jgi:hypothetical protein